jgi:hypothetical protein
MSTTNIPFQGWIANLSNGETVYETPPQEGEKSAWQKLLDFLTGNPEIKVTNLRVQRLGHNLIALPHKLCDGYFQAYELRKTIFSGEQDISQGCGSVIGDRIFIIWICSNGDIRQDIRPLEGGKIHTTLRG